MLLGNAMGVTAYDGIIHDDSGNISYVPLEQGTYSNGGYSIDKISHPTLGSGEIDGILTGEDQDRGNSYSWSAVESGDYVYIGTCYNPTLPLSPFLQAKKMLKNTALGLYFFTFYVIIIYRFIGI